MELHTSKVRLTSDGRLEIYCHRLSTRINKILKRYGEGAYRFKEGEEGLFWLKSPKDLELVKTVLYKDR